MSTPSNIDYDALAQQHGGTSSVDYDALAAQHGGLVHSSGAGAPHDIQAQPAAFSKAWLKSKLYEAADSIANSLPAIGATAGSIIGGTGGTLAEPGGGTALGAVGGAGVGGMGGEAAKQLLKRAVFGTGPQTSTEAAQDINKQGVIQAGTQAVGEVAPMAAKPLQQAAERQYARALAPTTKVNKAIVQEITPEMMDRGIKGSLPNIEEQASERADALTPQIDQAISQIPKANVQGASGKVVNALETLKGQYLVDGKVANPQAIKAIEGVQDIVNQFGDDVSPESLRKLRQIFDDPVAKKAGFAGADLSTQYTLQAQQKAGNTLRGILNEASPDVAALNKEMHFWLNVQKVTSESGLRQTGQQGGLLKVLGPLGVAVTSGTGIALGHGGAAQSLEGAGLTAALTATAMASRSPMWRTTSAVWKNSLADALASGNAHRAMLLLGRFGTAIVQAGTQANGIAGQTAGQ